MPTISMFYGITVSMYFKDNKQHKLPHIHIIYAGNKGVFSIKEKRLIKGEFPKRIINLVTAWIEIHYDELMANWELAINNEETYKIEPLK